MPLKSLHDPLALFHDAVDGIASLAFGRFADELEDLFQALDLVLGLCLVLLEGRAELVRLRGLCHLGQCGRIFFSAK